MKIDRNKKVRQVAGENIVIMQADGAADMTQVVALNESAMELYDRLKDSDFTVDDVVRMLLDIYEVDEATARHDAAEWVDQMRKQRLILD
ncbi:MAG: PqqD family protein [Bacteroidales bacterium]|nr:PqqD family protein [Bacteroidales bacterium]